MRNVFVGYDSKQDIAYQVCKHSLLKHSSNIAVQPIVKHWLEEQNVYSRPLDPKSSTEFTFTRFLVPFLNEYQGWALFCDSDFLFLDDVNNLFDQADDRYAVMCVQHNYTPKASVKMYNKTQYVYPRKNWSSLMLINCAHEKNKTLTPEFINNPQLTGQYLHRFSWLSDEHIGSLDHKWNWLSGYYKEENGATPSAIHYTDGGPWFDNYRYCEYSDIWKSYLLDMMYKG